MDTKDNGSGEAIVTDVEHRPRRVVNAELAAGILHAVATAAKKRESDGTRGPREDKNWTNEETRPLLDLLLSGAQQASVKTVADYAAALCYAASPVEDEEEDKEREEGQIGSRKAGRCELRIPNGDRQREKDEDEEEENRLSFIARHILDSILSLLRISLGDANAGGGGSARTIGSESDRGSGEQRHGAREENGDNSHFSPSSSFSLTYKLLKVLGGLLASLNPSHAFLCGGERGFDFIIKKSLVSPYRMVRLTAVRILSVRLHLRAPKEKSRALAKVARNEGEEKTMGETSKWVMELGKWISYVVDPPWSHLFSPCNTTIHTFFAHFFPPFSATRSFSPPPRRTLAMQVPPSLSTATPSSAYWEAATESCLLLVNETIRAGDGAVYFPPLVEATATALRLYGHRVLDAELTRVAEYAAGAVSNHSR